MPFLYVSGTNKYTSHFMRDINLGVKPQKVKPYSQKPNETTFALYEELTKAKISRRFFEIKTEQVSDTRTVIRVKIKNPLSPKEIALFRIGFGFKKFSHHDSRKNFNRHTDITGTFVHPELGSNMWEKRVDEDHFLESSEVSKVFREFLTCARDKFDQWDRLNTSQQNPATLPFQSSWKELRRITCAATNVFLAHRVNQADQPIGKSLPPEESRRLLSEPIPQSGVPITQIIKTLERDVYPNNLDEGHPRFFDYVPVAPNPVSVISHILSAGINPFVGSWVEASGSTQLELQTIDWIRQLVGFPDKGGGLFLNGGSEANMHGVRIGRKILLGDELQKVQQAVIYTSNQVNSSIYKGLQTLGFDVHNPHLFKELPVDNEFRLSVEALERAIKEDRQNGRLPFCVIGNFGTTGTGAIDPISEISNVCKRENLWLHVDAAYGGGFITSPTFRARFKEIGISEVNSLVINPHKAMFTTYGNSLLLVKDFSWFKETYQGKQKSPCLDDYKDCEVNFYECSPHFTRNDRQALELWMALKYYGVEKFGEAIDRLNSLAHIAAGEIRKDSKLKLVTGPNLSVITFKYNTNGLSIDEQNRLNTKIREEVNKTGFANIGKTSLNGETVLRMCIINPQTTEKDIRSTIELVKNIGDELSSLSKLS